MTDRLFSCKCPNCRQTFKAHSPRAGYCAKTTCQRAKADHLNDLRRENRVHSNKVKNEQSKFHRKKSEKQYPCQGCGDMNVNRFLCKTCLEARLKHIATINGQIPSY